MPGRPRLYLEIFLLSLAVMLLEVSYTRIFSFKLVYYFTYLIIGIALLGIGTGGVLIALLPRLRGRSPESLIPGCAALGAAGVLVGYFVVARVQLNSFDLVGAVLSRDLGTAAVEGAKLIAICLALFWPFLFAGLAIAAIFAGRTEAVNRLYFADLLGAALGCAVCVPAMVLITPPGCVLLAGAALAGAGVALAMQTQRTLLAPLAGAIVLCLGGAALASHLPDVVVDHVKTMSPQELPQPVFSRWHPIFRVDVLENKQPGTDGLMLAHDGMWGSVLPHYDGDAAGLTRYDQNPRSYPFRLLPPGPEVAIIGAAGGNEILASLHFGAKHVTGVELNPVTVSLLTQHFADYTGHVASDPRVSLINAEGRGFLMRDEKRYDLIWFVAPDSYAAMNAATSGAYVLSESYLYTEEMLTESLRSLTPGGVVCTQFGEPAFERKPNRTLRYLNTARAAYARLGIGDFPGHVLLATAKGFVFTTSTILLKREPFTADEIDRFVRATAEIPGGQVRHAPGQPPGEHAANSIISGSPADLARFQHDYPFDVSPVTDDAPFFWHFVSFRQALHPAASLQKTALEEGMGERLLIVMLVVVTLFAAVFLLAPLLTSRDLWREIPHKGTSLLYFAALGVGFMFLEVSLIQRLTLFLGFPTYSLTVTLCALLLSTGLGSWLGAQTPLPRNRMALRLGGALVLLVAFYLLALAPLVHAGIGWPLTARVLFTIAILTPLGLCLGMFMPLGLRTVAGLSAHPEAYVAWAWAVNGFCSVVSSVLTTLCSMMFGFDVVMVMAVAVYGVALFALMRLPEPRSLDVET